MFIGLCSQQVVKVKNKRKLITYKIQIEINEIWQVQENKITFSPRARSNNRAPLDSTVTILHLLLGFGYLARRLPHKFTATHY